MLILKFLSYKKYVLERIQKMPSRGRGQLQKIAKTLRIHNTRLSNILHGSVHFSLEQANELSDYFKLNEIETEYFLALVQYERAGSEKFRNTMRKHLEGIKVRAQEVVHRVTKTMELGDSERAIFYSSWFYCAIHLHVTTPGVHTLDSISKRFELPIGPVKNAIKFLVSTGLCLEKDGTYVGGVVQTHLASNDPMVSRHHINWRLKALEGQDRVSETELAYSCPVSLSEKDFSAFRKELVSLIERFIQRVTQSKPEEKLACLVIDWFKI